MRLYFGEKSIFDLTQSSWTEKMMICTAQFTNPRPVLKGFIPDDNTSKNRAFFNLPRQDLGINCLVNTTLQAPELLICVR